MTHKSQTRCNHKDLTKPESIDNVRVFNTSWGESKVRGPYLDGYKLYTL